MPEFKERLKNIRLVVWDFDGTIVHLPLDWKLLKKEISSSLYSLTGEEISQLTIAEALEIAGAKAGASAREKIQELCLQHELGAIEKALIYPYSLKLILRWLQEGKKLAIFSNNSRQTILNFLHRQGLEKTFSWIKGFEDLSRPKPDGYGLKTIISESSFSPSETLFVGNSIQDLDAGSACGVETITIQRLPFEMAETDGGDLRQIHFELTNRCNLSCTFCPVKDLMTRPKGDIDPGIFYTLLEQYPFWERIGFNIWGEPLLYSGIFKMVSKASQKNIETIFCTNGTLLNEDTIEKILSSGLSKLEISLDGYGKSFEKVRGFSYNEISNKIELLLKMRRESKASLKVGIASVIADDTEKDFRRLQVEWRGKVDYIKAIPVILYRSFDRQKRCPQLWNCHLAVLQSGTVVPCCVDYNGELALGDAASEPLDRLYNGRRMKIFRRFHLQGRFPQLCRKCQEYESRKAQPRFG